MNGQFDVKKTVIIGQSGLPGYKLPKLTDLLLSTFPEIHHHNQDPIIFLYNAIFPAKMKGV